MILDGMYWAWVVMPYRAFKSIPKFLKALHRAIQDDSGNSTMIAMMLLIALMFAMMALVAFIIFDYMHIIANLSIEIQAPLHP